MIPEICRAGGWLWHRPKRQDLTGPPGAWRAKFTACSQVNVAVSRARRRLYVIGDRTAWSKYRYFDTLSRYLMSELDS